MAWIEAVEFTDPACSYAWGTEGNTAGSAGSTPR
jgi:hypothetical protein